MSKSAGLRLDWSRRQLGSGDPRQLTNEIPKGLLSYEEVDFSLNNLSSDGLKAVLEVCKRCPKLRVLKLFKNRIDDVGAEHLADLCRALPGIEEMHLSHNHFTAAGVKKMVVAAEGVRKPDAPPLWLRVEQNMILEPDAVFDELVEQELSVCKRVDDKSCTARVCKMKCKVHLPFFHLQRWNANQYQQPPSAPTNGTNGVSPKTAAAGYRPPTLPRPPMTTGQSPSHAGNAASPGGANFWGCGGCASAAAKGGAKGKLVGPADAHCPTASKGGKGGSVWENSGHATAVDNSASQELPKAVNGTQLRRPPPVAAATGLRRILPEQMQDMDAGSQMICTLCQYVMVNPVITKCSHLVCDPCFKSWVSAKVAEHKQGPTAGQRMAGMPCPICHELLKMDDVTPLDRAQGPATALLQRRWRNMQIRCVHHRDNFKYSFGKDAEWLYRETGLECCWIGDQVSFENHLRQCPIEGKLSQRCEPVSENKVMNVSGGEPFAEPEPVTMNSNSDDEEFEIREVRYDFEGVEASQLSLRQGDMIKIFEVTGSGWAAGVKIYPESLEEIGEAGWFPSDYLHDTVKTTQP